MREKPKLEFEVDFETGKTVPIHMGRLTLGSGKDVSVVRFLLMPDGLHMFYEQSKFTHASAFSSDLYYELSGIGTEPTK